jgi:flavin reductase (DIM6/NTAB) family NADH-FMN oxidoreductase RutF
MAKKPVKRDFPVSEIRRYLEPGPVVLVSSRWRNKTNIMTLGWHTVMEFAPALVGCVIASSNYSFDLIRKAHECVINLPTTALADTVVKIGNSSGAVIDKFAAFGLTLGEGAKIAAPLICECHANFECRLHDGRMIDKYNFFIFEVVKAHVAATPKHPKTLHYAGNGIFTVPGEVIDKRSLFRPEMLT